MPKPIRILHVVGGMNRAGVETWLMHVLRHIDRSRFQMDFLVHTNEPCAYDEEIRALGSRIISCLHPSHPLQYARNFKRILREYGPYDVVHSHVHHYSGFTLWLAHQAGVPVRIAHSHNDTGAAEAKASLSRQVYLSLSKNLIQTHATVGLACSRKAANDLYGADWEKDSRWRILYYAIDLTPFSEIVDKSNVRAELGIPEDALVVGHVGRFAEQKNHVFLVEIAAEVVKREPKTRFLLIGDGVLRPQIEAKVFAAGLKEHFIFAGLRDDIPRLMMGAMDVFLFPSLYEGLGLVLVEAQSADLPFLVSDNIPDEASIIPELSHKLPLSASAANWAEEILSITEQELKINRAEALEVVRQRQLNIETSLANLIDFYGEAVSGVE